MGIRNVIHKLETDASYREKITDRLVRLMIAAGITALLATIGLVMFS